MNYFKPRIDANEREFPSRKAKLFVNGLNGASGYGFLFYPFLPFNPFTNGFCSGLVHVLESSNMIETPVFFSYLKSPLGRLLLVCNGAGLNAIRFEKEAEDFSLPREWRNEAEPFQLVIAQLEAYFAGELRDFDVPLAPQGTSFQRSVWEVLQKIPYGETISYAEVARRINKPAAVRAVGAANGSNPIPIIIPCHRVIGSNGALVGYGGGLHIKKALLGLEKERHAKTLPQVSLF